jgi:hypothetical protein
VQLPRREHGFVGKQNSRMTRGMRSVDVAQHLLRVATCAPSNQRAPGMRSLLNTRATASAIESRSSPTSTARTPRGHSPTSTTTRRSRRTAGHVLCSQRR